MSDALVFCWASGLIEVGAHCPKGTVLLGSGPSDVLKEAISATARLSYNNRHWLVPGVPEAADEDAAVDAVTVYRDRLKLRLARAGVPV